MCTEIDKNAPATNSTDKELKELGKLLKLLGNFTIIALTGFGLWHLANKVISPEKHEVKSVFEIGNSLTNMVETQVYEIGNADAAILIIIVLSWCGIALTLINILSRPEDDR